MAKVLAFVMAGGEGKRLFPLTSERSKPAVPFGGCYRIVDFVLSNLVNSGIFSIYLLVQYKSQSLIEHIRKTWIASPLTSQQFVTIVPPQMRGGPEWFQGTADAVYQNLNLVHMHKPDLVAIFGADHIYRMDMRQMVNFHLEQGADATVAVIPVSPDAARSFGVVAVDPQSRITAFWEKPENPRELAIANNHCFASMGNYIFKADLLLKVLEHFHLASGHDFGKDVLPALVGEKRVMAYDFSTNSVPGIKPCEEKSYWRDVGSIESYFNAHRDLLGRAPHFDLFNPDWPIHSNRYLGPNARISDAVLHNTHIGAGSSVAGAHVENSVIGSEVVIEEDVEIRDSVLLGYTIVRRGVKIKRAIVDRYNVLEPGIRIGYSTEQAMPTHHISPSGVTVVPIGHRGIELVY